MKKAVIIAIDGKDTNLVEIDSSKYTWVATEKGKGFIRVFYKPLI